MRRVWPLFLVACSGSSSEPQIQAAPAATEPAAAVSTAPDVEEPMTFGAPVAPAVATPERATQLWNARPSLLIAAVFATEDGRAAVSIDAANHARLWPALDGKREPFALPFAQTAVVALGRDGDGFAIAALDDSDGLEVITVTGTGLLTSHLKAPPEPGFDALIANDAGFLVLRRDQTLEQRDRRGEVIATLAPPPGEHVVKLLHRSGRTLALVRTTEGLRGHWLAADKLAWGDATPKLVIVPNRAFISPDHKRLVSVRPPRGEATLVNLETGRAQPLASPNSETGENGTFGHPIGFTADGRVVFAFNDFELSTFEWWTQSGRKTAVLGGSKYELEHVIVDNAVVTDNNVITSSGRELAIATPNTVSAPSEVHFLGYRTPRAKGLRSSPVGVVATIGGVAMLLDDQVHVERRVPALDGVPLADDLALITFSVEKSSVDVSNAIDPDWLETPVRRPRDTRSHPRIALFDLETKQDLQRWPTPKAFRFEPATQLLAFDRGGKIELQRFDPTTRTFGAPHAFAARVTELQLLDPALADGNLAVFARARGTLIETQMIRDLDAELPAATTLTGKLEAIDRAGRIYAREEADTIVVHRRDGTQARLAGMAGWTVRPSPTGTQIAAFGRSRLMLLDDAGSILWSAGAPGIRDVAWTPDGKLVVLAGDLASLDVATGRVTAAQCGWGFALRDLRPEFDEGQSTAETLCDR